MQRKFDKNKLGKPLREKSCKNFDNQTIQESKFSQNKPKLQISSNHQIIPSKNTQTQIHSKCALHEKNLEAFCSDCFFCVCISCMIDNSHKGHLFESVEVALKNHKESMFHVSSELHSKRNKIHMRYEAICLNQFEDEQKIRKYKEHVNNKIEVIQMNLDEHKLKFETRVKLV